MKINKFKEKLNEIHNLADRIPKTMDEAIHFGEDSFENENLLNDESDIESEDTLNPEEDFHGDVENQELNPKGKELVDRIRKVSLQGMADLADTPEIPEYDILKKIWQICDKALVQKKEEHKEE